MPNKLVNNKFLLELATINHLEGEEHRVFSVGADVDHLDTMFNFDLYAEVECSLYTIDLGKYVDNATDKVQNVELMQKVKVLPFEMATASLLVIQ